MAALGKADSRDEAITYLMSMSNGLIDLGLATTFVETGPEMVAFLTERTPIVFQCVPDFPDYHPEQPGGKPGGGRTLECPRGLSVSVSRRTHWRRPSSVGTPMLSRVMIPISGG